MRRYGMQPMVVINSADQIPDLIIVTLCRWLWRYRSELAPLIAATLTVLAGWALHAHIPHGGQNSSPPSALPPRPASWASNSASPPEPNVATR